MLIYAAVLHLDCEVAQAEQIICKWISRKLRLPIQRLPLHVERNGAEFRTFSHRGTDQTLIWMSFTHPDHEVAARQWRTEVGLREDKVKKVLECSVVLEATDDSDQPIAPFQLNRPFIVRSLLFHCNPISPTPGMALLEMDDNDVYDWLQYIEDKKRQHPIVLLSPKKVSEDGEEVGGYAIPPQEVLFYLGGIADVVAIAEQADIDKIAEGLGERFAVKHGEINMIFPPVESDSDPAERVFPIKRLSLEEIELLGEPLELKPEMQLLGVVTHRMNQLNYSRHISLEYVREQMRLQHLHHQNARQKHEQDDYALVLEAENRAKAAEIAKLTADNELLQQQLTQRETRIEELTIENQRMQLDLDSALKSVLQSNRSPAEPSPDSAQAILPRDQGIGIDEESRERLVHALQGTATVEEALLAIGLLFKDRIVTLPTAVQSAGESREFLYRDRAFRLLLKFATDYWEALNSGKGYQIARRIFGDAFTSGEAENLERNWRAPELREDYTFDYKDDQITMPKHLRIGVNNNARESLRIHFYWDADDRKLVIGHCGPPLQPFHR